MSLYFKFMTGKSSWVPSRTQGSIPMLFCRWSNVLWLLHPLSVPSHGWWLDQGRWSLCLFVCFCGNDRTMTLYQTYRVCCNFKLWSFRYLKNLVCNNFKHSDVFYECCNLDVLVDGDRETYYDLGCYVMCGLKSFEISRTTGIIWA